MARVLFENVRKVFDGKIPAVTNLTLDVAALELMVIVGPSGCGKTTTLRMVAGLEEVTDGSSLLEIQSLTTSLLKTAISQWSFRTMHCIRT